MTRWWAVQGGPDNHTYAVDEHGVQRCRLCDTVEPPLRVPTGDEYTDRAAAHMVHSVRMHIDVTAAEWGDATPDPTEESP